MSGCFEKSLMTVNDGRRIILPMDRSELLAHLRRTRFAPGDRDKALADARRIAVHLKSEYGAEVFGVGSLFESPRPFTRKSDIDLVVKGVPPEQFIRVSADMDGMSQFEINLIPWETANKLMREITETGGVKL